MFRAVLVSGLLAAALVSGPGCSAPPESLTDTRETLAGIIQDGITIPQFPSAADQLNYARSGLAGRQEKMAALRAVKTLFGQDRMACGQAALGLAYLHLEPQYRFASDLDIQRAIKDFQAVANQYQDLPDVQAKALWYLGWIHTELAQDLKKAMGYYWQVAKAFDHIPLSLSHTAPWVTLVYGLEPVHKMPQAPEKDWAQVALLEIVRHSPDTGEAIAAIHLLLDRYPASQAAGLALKHMLADPVLAPHAQAPAADYLAKKPANPYLARDIQTLAKAAAP